MDLTKIEKEVIESCLDVGAFILREGESFDRTRIETKTGFNNLVSYVDKEAERRLVQALRDALPEAGFITEEGTVAQSESHHYNWIIDPLDGTTNFLHGLPVYGISIGLTRGKETILGVVYHIPANECYHALEGGPAQCNGRAIRVSSNPNLNDSLLATGFPYHQDGKKEKHLEVIKDFLTHTHGIRRLGSAAIDLAYVASGKLEGFFEFNLNPWDVAAGAFIVQQAGGHVTDFQGGDNFLFGNQLCASNKFIHPEMLNVIQQHWYA